MNSKDELFFQGLALCASNASSVFPTFKSEIKIALSAKHFTPQLLKDSS